MNSWKRVGAVVLLLAGCLSMAWAQPVGLGAGVYFASPKGGDRVVPRASFRTEAMQKTAAQSAQWYSTLLYNPKPEAIYAQPLSIKPTLSGLEVALPAKEVVSTERLDTEIHYPHKDPLIISPTAFEPGQSRLAKADDWSIGISMSNGQDQMDVTVAHGMPYAQIQISRGDVRVRLPSPGERLEATADPRVLALRLNGKTYAVFAPTGATWQAVTSTEWVGHLPPGKGYLSVAGLPNDKKETLQLFAAHAYAFVEATHVEWRYDKALSRVETTFTAATKIMEGPDNGPLLGLYPHQWFNNPLVESKLGPAFETIRGKLRLLEAKQFSVRQTYTGFVPYWPGVKGTARDDDLNDVMKSDKRNARRMMLEEGQGPYWQGKGLQRIMKVLDVVEQQGDLDGRDKLLAMVEERAEQWLKGEGQTYFHYDKAQGVVASYPEEFFTVEQLNDHHFTYGYWIRAAADIALRDPQWAAKEKWGAMIDLLVSDIASTTRNSNNFPFLRNFDPYEGHSWASGIGMGRDGNNQESSSEAVNAWAGLILWGEIKGDTALRDLGVYMYTTEISAINNYWFDINKLVFAPEYKNMEVSQLFGAAYAHNTWWIDDPREIKGINLLPITTVSLYLGASPSFVKANVASLKPEIANWESRGKSIKPLDIWQDLFAQYLGMADPTAGLAKWDRWGSFELGETRTHALHWLLSLQKMGTPDLEVTADTTLYSVFKKQDGTRSYLAYNAGKAPITVTFSDGKTLTVEPGKLGSSP